MKVREVILRAMAGRLKWPEAAEVAGVVDHAKWRWRQRYEEHGYDGLFQRQARKTESEADPGGGGAQSLPEGLLRLQRAAFSSEAGGRARHQTVLHVGKAGVAGRRAGEEAEAPGAAPAVEAVVAGDTAAHRRQPAPIVSG